MHFLLAYCFVCTCVHVCVYGEVQMINDILCIPRSLGPHHLLIERYEITYAATHTHTVPFHSHCRPSSFPHCESALNPQALNSMYFVCARCPRVTVRPLFSCSDRFTFIPLKMRVFVWEMYTVFIICIIYVQVGEARHLFSVLILSAPVDAVVGPRPLLSGRGIGALNLIMDVIRPCDTWVPFLVFVL